MTKQQKRAVTVHEIADELGWKRSLVYKHLKEAVLRKLLKYEHGTREHNLKRVLPRLKTRKEFLPNPQLVLRKNPEIGEKVEYIDPFTGTLKKVKR